MKKLLSIFLCLILFILTDTNIFCSEIKAQNETKDKYEQFVSNFNKNLHLTQKQKQEIKELRKNFKLKNDMILKEISVKKQKIKQLKNSKYYKFNFVKRNEVENLKNDIEILKKRKIELKLEERVKFEIILNEKQNFQLKKMLEELQK